MSLLDLTCAKIHLSDLYISNLLPVDFWNLTRMLFAGLFIRLIHYWVHVLKSKTDDDISSNTVLCYKLFWYWCCSRNYQSPDLQGDSRARQWLKASTCFKHRVCRIVWQVLTVFVMFQIRPSVNSSPFYAADVQICGDMRVRQLSFFNFSHSYFHEWFYGWETTRKCVLLSPFVWLIGSRLQSLVTGHGSLKKIGEAVWCRRQWWPFTPPAVWPFRAVRNT